MKYKKSLEFLWPHDKGSLEEALYEFGMAQTEHYAKEWYQAILERLPRANTLLVKEPISQPGQND